MGPSGLRRHPQSRQSAQGDSAAYAKDMEVVVFNAHIHTTEVFDVDGVKYLMLGGRGAEQDPILPGAHERQASVRLSAGPLLEGGSRPRRSTATCWWMSKRARRLDSSSSASGRGRPSRSPARNCSSKKRRRHGRRVIVGQTFSWSFTDWLPWLCWARSPTRHGYVGAGARAIRFVLQSLPDCAARLVHQRRRDFVCDLPAAIRPSLERAGHWQALGF